MAAVNYGAIEARFQLAETNLLLVQGFLDEYDINDPKVRDALNEAIGKLHESREAFNTRHLVTPEANGDHQDQQVQQDDKPKPINGRRSGNKSSDEENTL